MNGLCITVLSDRAAPDAGDELGSSEAGVPCCSVVLFLKNTLLIKLPALGKTRPDT